jgi:hypothetical protein
MEAYIGKIAFQNGALDIIMGVLNGCNPSTVTSTRALGSLFQTLLFNERADALITVNRDFIA